MKQILVNLISNSLKYSQEKTKISISLNCSSNNAIVIIIQDQGVGMSKEQTELALKKHQRINNQNSEQYSVDSFGLGLHMVKRLVELQGGEMVIESKLGEGTRVRLGFGDG